MNVFLDTNILIYRQVATSPFHEQARRRLAELRQNQAVFWIAYQSLREYFSVMTRPQACSPALTVSQAVHDWQQMIAAFCLTAEGPEVNQALQTLISKKQLGGKQIHDANIVAMMQVYQIEAVLTHNIADFKRFEPLIQVLPLFDTASTSGV